MAKFSNGFMGPFSGKLGPAVGYTWNGKWCMRSYQKYIKNPRTEAQVAHREMFKQEVQLAARMRWAVVKTMTDAARAEGMTSYNLFVKCNQHAFSLEEGILAVDYANLRMSMGDVPGVVAERVERTADNVLSVSFARGTGRAFDQVSLYVYAPDLGTGFLASPVYRRDRRVSVALPDEFEGLALHAWLMVQGEDGRWSNSNYMAVSGLEVPGELRPETADTEPLVRQAAPTSLGGPELAEGVVAVDEEHPHQAPPSVRD